RIKFCLTPLFKEEGNLGFITLLFYFQYPFFFYKARFCTRFAPNNNPIYFFKIEVWQSTNEGFKRKEFCFCPRFSKKVYPFYYSLIFNRSSHPNVFCPIKFFI